MSKKETINFLKREINKLNRVIDKKIILGKDWSKERKEHLKLLNAIRELSGGIYA